MTIPPRPRRRADRQRRLEAIRHRLRWWWAIAATQGHDPTPRQQGILATTGTRCSGPMDTLHRADRTRQERRAAEAAHDEPLPTSAWRHPAALDPHRQRR